MPKRVTVIVCTRDRGDSVARVVRSIMVSDFQSFELIVVDQSDDEIAQSSLAEWRDDARFIYLRSATRGLAHARNIAISRAQGGIIAMTDDDCEASTSWISRMAESFEIDEHIGVVLGNVERARHDTSAGFIPGYIRTEPYLAKGIRDKPKVEGIGASMAIRRDVWRALGGFDPMLGAGARFRSADDTDIIIRALLAGYYVYENPAAVVLHHGFRTHADADELTAGYLMGIGATLAKHLKCGRFEMLRVMLALGARWGFSRPVVEYGFKPARLPRLRGFAEGFVKAALTPVNRKASMFAGTQLPGVADRKTADRQAFDA